MTWQIIIELTGNKRNKQSFKKITHEGKTIVNRKVMSELFNDYFINTGANLKKNAKRNTDEITNIDSIQNIKPCLIGF